MGGKFAFGILGAGNIAHKFCKAIKLLDDAEVVAVASRTPGKAKAFADDNNLPDAYDGYQELLERRDIDAVYIATTHNFHKENILAALENGKHVLCEKAMVLTRKDAEEVFAKAAEKKLFVMEAMWSRFLPAVQKAKGWIGSGRLGRIDLANFIIGFKADPNPKGRILNPRLAGGAMFDVGVYAIEIMTYLLPEKLVRADAVLTRAETGVDKVDNIILQFENAVVNLQCVVTCGVQNELNIYGTEGRIHMENPHFGDSVELYDEKGLAERFYCRLDNGFEYEIRECIDCIRAGKLESSVIPHRDTIQCAALFDTCFMQNQTDNRSVGNAHE